MVGVLDNLNGDLTAALAVLASEFHPMHLADSHFLQLGDLDEDFANLVVRNKVLVHRTYFKRLDENIRVAVIVEGHVE